MKLSDLEKVAKIKHELESMDRTIEAIRKEPQVRTFDAMVGGRDWSLSIQTLTHTELLDVAATERHSIIARLALLGVSVDEPAPDERVDSAQ